MKWNLKDKLFFTLIILVIGFTIGFCTHKAISEFGPPATEADTEYVSEWDKEVRQCLDGYTFENRIETLEMDVDILFMMWREMKEDEKGDD